MKTINDLSQESIKLFKKRAYNYFLENFHDEVDQSIDNGLNSRIEHTTDILESLGLRYDKEKDKLVSYYGAINNLDTWVEVTTECGKVGEFDLIFEEERESLYEFLDEVTEYKVTDYSSEWATMSETTDLREVLYTFHLLAQLSEDQQELFVEVYTDGYVNSPMDLAERMVGHLKDW